MQKIVQIDGGIGRVVCSTSALNTLSEQNEVILITSWPEVFHHNPNILKVYGMNREYIWDDVIRHGDFIYPEPYFMQKYYTQEYHLSQSFNTILNGEANFGFPKLYLTLQEIEWGNNFVKTIKSQYFGKLVVAYQPFGASAIFDNGVVTDATFRSLSMDSAKFIAENVKDIIFVNCSHINMDHKNVWQANLTLRELFAVVHACDNILTVDSMLSHVGAAFQKTGVLLLGSTFSKNVGYPNYTTLQRDGYPKNYYPNRFSGFVDKNKGAMDFTASEFDMLLSVLNERNFPLTFTDVVEGRSELSDNNNLY